MSSLLMYSITLVLSALMAVRISRFCRFLAERGGLIWWSYSEYFTLHKLNWSIELSTRDYQPILDKMLYLPLFFLMYIL